MTSIERREGRYQRRKAARDKKRYEQVKDALDFEKVFSFTHLYHSAHKCFRGVEWKGSVQAYRAKCGMNVERARRKLMKGKFTFRKCPEFYLRERGHLRRINSIHIIDRVPQKCNSLYALKPVLHRSLIHDNYASQTGKGTSLARGRMKCHLQRHIGRHGLTGGILILDFRHFFDSVDHKLIRELMEKNFPDKRIVDFNMAVVQQYRDGVGMVLGSENSQDFAISVPNGIDHAILEKMGAESYGRYMDDMRIMCSDYEKLKHIYAEVGTMASLMKFELNHKKTKLVRFGKPFTYMKRRYSFTETGGIIIRPTSDSAIRERRKLKRICRKVKRGELPESTAQESIKAWRASLSDSHYHKASKRMDALYEELMGKPAPGTGRKKEASSCITKSYQAA